MIDILLLLAVGTVFSPIVVKFPCPKDAPVGIFIGSNTTLENSTFSTNTCAFKAEHKVRGNITINGERFDWCVTRNGNTECHKAKKQ